jgi:hypothetical protein
MRLMGLGVLAVLFGMTTLATAQTSRSATAAERLASALKQRNLQHLAAADPSEAGRYVAAMRIGDSQLFLVTARYAQPILLNERLHRSDYEGAYLELNSASHRDGRLFVQDLGSPGLHAARQEGGAFDIVYESATTRTVLDGDWKAQKLSKDEYHSAFDRVDTQYARALDALLAALGEGTSGGGLGTPR